MYTLSYNSVIAWRNLQNKIGDIKIMPVNWSDIGKALPNSTYWETRYLIAKCELLGLKVFGVADFSDKQPLMGLDEWSDWYDKEIPEDVDTMGIALLHEQKIAELRSVE